MSLIIAGIAFVCILAVVVVLLFAINRMIKPILKYSETVKCIADCDLTCRVEDIKGKDEIAAMNNSVGNMVHNLNVVVYKVSGVSNGVMSLSGDFAACFYVTFLFLP